MAVSPQEPPPAPTVRDWRAEARALFSPARIYHRARAVLRSADLPTLLDGHERILNRLAAIKVRSHWIVRHDVPAVRLALRPVQGLSPERAAAFASHLRRASLPSREVRLPSEIEGAERALLVAPAGVSTDPDDVPSMAALLQRPVLLDGRPFLPAASLTLREEVVQARIAKAGKILENVDVRLREPFRMKVVAKVKAGEGTLDFKVVDPKHAPTLVSIRGDATVSVLFVNLGGEFELERTDHRRVKPYAEQFGVQIGELKALDF